MTCSPTELEAFVRQRAPDIARNIRAAAQRSRNEADLVAAVEQLLERFARNCDVTLNLERERTWVNGCVDAVHNRFANADSLRPKLSELSRETHVATRAGDTVSVQTNSAEIDGQAAQLWGLADAECRKIQESSRELG